MVHLEIIWCYNQVIQFNNNIKEYAVNIQQKCGEQYIHTMWQHDISKCDTVQEKTWHHELWGEMTLQY